MFSQISSRSSLVTASFALFFFTRYIFPGEQVLLYMFSKPFNTNHPIAIQTAPRTARTTLNQYPPYSQKAVNSVCLHIGFSLLLLRCCSTASCVLGYTGASVLNTLIPCLASNPVTERSGFAFRSHSIGVPHQRVIIVVPVCNMLRFLLLPGWLAAAAGGYSPLDESF